MGNSFATSDLRLRLGHGRPFVLGFRLIVKRCLSDRAEHRIIKEISQALEAAEIILLLVSADFLASDYCFGIEMSRALERHSSGDAVVVPVILRACDWQHSPFKHLNALPSGGREIAKWAYPDDAFLNVVQGLRKLLAARPARANVLAAAVGRTAAAREAGELSEVRSPRPSASRSSNLALPTEFSDEAKHDSRELGIAIWHYDQGAKE